MFDVVPLGVGAAVPTASRHLSGTLVRREGRSVLFDCGEGAQLQLVRGGLTRGPLDAICVTHLHGDHLFGLPGLLTTLSLLERDTPLTVVGPQGIAGIASLPGVAAIPYPLTFRELTDEDGAVVFEDDGITIEARPLEHRVPCWGYRYQERERPGSIDGAAARAAGVTEGWQFEALKRGETVALADGTELAPDGLVGPPRPGGAFAYVLDTVPCDGGRALAREADLLLHEATFTQAHADRAEAVAHSTARQAAEVARDAGARRLLLTHFSARYAETDGLVAEARAVFPESEAAEELRRYEVRR
ncbi:ribonuclease Z [Rubrivirga sp. IMCC45206]|uniref:ribonuclease Z n=1 Tax=Rubrivirga sp. IMCC45206 TaxID=3391614 RepID=UPI00398FE532